MADECKSQKLAIDGGPKTRTDPWPPRRLFGDEEKRAVVELFDRCIDAGEAFGYNGPEEEAYCAEFAEFHGGGFADGVNSGTNAVYVALRGLECEPFSEIIVPAVSDPGGVMPVALMNCIPVPADCAPGSFNVGPEQIAERITDRTGAIVVAHISGIPADMDPIMELARSKNIPVVEDCAQAHGAEYKGKKVGTLGDIAAYSTMFGKHHATGGQGGVVYTKSEELYWKARQYADRGKPFGIESGESNVAAGLNCNMDEIHAVIGRVQLRKLPGIIEGRRRVGRALEAGCRERLQTVRLVTGPEEVKPVFWFLLFRLDMARLRVDKETFVKALDAEGVSFRPTYLVVPTRMSWHEYGRVFGKTSRMPWTGPGGEIFAKDRDLPLPNIEETDAAHISFQFNEQFGEAEIESILTALEKVERAYLR